MGDIQESKVSNVMGIISSEKGRREMTGGGQSPETPLLKNLDVGCQIQGSAFWSIQVVFSSRQLTPDVPKDRLRVSQVRSGCSF